MIPTGDPCITCPQVSCDVPGCERDAMRVLLVGIYAGTIVLVILWSVGLAVMVAAR